MPSTEPPLHRLKTGIAGLDDVLTGGLPAASVYLLQGDPGVGKTTLALQFLLEGVRNGERCLYVTLSETRRELFEVARSHGWSLDGLDLYELSAAEERTGHEAEQTMFHPAEVELEETTRPLLDEIARLRPHRLVIDSLSEIRLLAREPLRYRRQILALKKQLLDFGSTVILVDDKTAGAGDSVLQTIAHGVIVLEAVLPPYGTSRRRLMVTKLRGVAFREGYHDYRVTTGGLEVYPRLVAAEHGRAYERGTCASGLPELDALVGGGLDRGTSTLFMGASGTGKSSLAAQYALAAAERGEKSLIFAFDESLATWTARAESLGMNVRPHLASGGLRLVQVDPAELSPGHFAQQARDAVEKEGRRLVVIDSINAYLQSVPGESFLLLHLHELLTYLGQLGTTTILVMAQAGLVGPPQSPVDVSYLADTIVLLRYFEHAGSLRQAISVVKKRSGLHERTIREFRLTARGVRVGEPLTDFRGVLAGVPAFDRLTPDRADGPR